MKLTANYRLRKPDGTDPVEVQDFNDNADVIDTELAKKADKTGVATDMTTAFSQAGTRANLTSGEKLSVSLGKLMKWFADLKTVAFSGSYTDLSNKPTIPSGGAASHNVITTMSDAMAVTQPGYVPDVRLVKELNNDLGGNRFGITADGQPGYKKAGADTVYPFRSDFKVVKLGEITTPTGSFNLSTYSGFKNFLVEKNIWMIVTNAMGTGRSDMDGTYYANCQPTAFYVADTGVLTISGLKGSESHGVSVNCQVAVYLAYMPA